MTYLSASGAVSVLFTQGAVLGCKQQMALTFSLAFPLLSLRAGLQVFAVSQQAAGQRWAPATRLVWQTGQTRHVPRAGTWAVRLQEQEGDLLEGDYREKRIWGKILCFYWRKLIVHKMAEMYTTNCLCRLNFFVFVEKHRSNSASTHTSSRQSSVPNQGHLTGLSRAWVVKVALSLNKVMVAPGQVGEQSTPICARQQLQLLLLLGCPTTHHLLFRLLKDAKRIRDEENVEKS